MQQQALSKRRPLLLLDCVLEHNNLLLLRDSAFFKLLFLFLFPLRRAGTSHSPASHMLDVERHTFRAPLMDHCLLLFYNLIIIIII